MSLIWSEDDERAFVGGWVAERRDAFEVLERGIARIIPALLAYDAIGKHRDAMAAVQTLAEEHRRWVECLAAYDATGATPGTWASIRELLEAADALSRAHGKVARLLARKRAQFPGLFG